MMTLPFLLLLLLLLLDWCMMVHGKEQVHAHADMLSAESHKGLLVW